MTSNIIIQNGHDNKNSTSTQKLKYTLFQLFTTANKYRNINKTIGVLLMLTSFIQTSSFFKFHNPNEEIDEFQAKYKPISFFLNPNIYLFPDIASQELIEAIEIIIYCFIVLLIFIISLLMYLAANTKTYYLTSFLAKYTFLLMQWVLFLPFVQVLAQTISFKSGSNIPKSIAHIILIVIFAVFQFALCYFNLIASTNSYDFFYIKDGTISFNLFFIQSVSLGIGITTYYFPFYLFLDYMIILAMLIHCTFTSLKHFAFYSKSFLRTYIVLLCMLYERLLNSMINKYTLSNTSEPFHTYNIATLAVMIFSYALIEKMLFKQIRDYSLRMNINKIKSTSEFVKFFESINDIILANASSSSISDNEYRIKRIGLTMNHLMHCSKGEKCLLKSKDELYLPRVRITSQKNVPAYNDQVKSVFMIKELFNKFYHSFQFHFEFCLCYILFIIYTIGNNELALSEIEMSKRFVSLSFSQEYIMHLLKEHANDNIMNICEQQNDSNDFDSIKNLKSLNGKQAFLPKTSNNDSNANYSSSTGNNGHEINFLHNLAHNSMWSVISMLNVINYDRISTNLKKYIYLCLDTKRELWKLFLNEDIIIEEVFKIGRRLFEYKSKITLLWSEITLVSNDQADTEITRIYCDYLDKICDDKIESRFILEKTPVFISNTPDELYNNRYKADTGILIIEVNCAYNSGKITYINQPLVSMLGYHKNELIGNNVKVIIPGVIGRYHDEIVINYFEKGRSDILRRTMNTMSVKSKEKYLIPVHLLVTIMPNLGKKMEGIGLIRPQLKKKVETIITTESGIIEALTVNMGHLLNITPSLIEKSRIYVQTFFPELMKPDKGIPKFMTDEYFANNKPIDLKINILCPHKNSIDKNKLKVKTRNIYINQLNVNSTNANDPTINKGILKANDDVNATPTNPQEKKSQKYSLTINHNNDFKENSLIEQRELIHNTMIHKNPINTQLEIPNPNILSIPNKNQLSASTRKRSLFTQTSKDSTKSNQRKGDNLLHLHPSNNKFTPEMDLIAKYRKAMFARQHDSMKTKLIEIYSRMLSAHDYHTLTEKAQVILIHLGMKIYNNSIPLRILMIPSEMLFEEKKIEEDFSCSSEINVAENKHDNLIQKANNEDDLKEFLEIGSVSGIDADLLLHRHLKRLKKDKPNQFIFHKAIGLLIGMIVVATELVIIFLSNDLYQYVMNFNTLLKQAFTLNTLLVDIAKYATIDQLERRYSLTNYDAYSNATEMRTKRSSALLDLLDDYFGLVQSIYSAQKINEAYNDRILNFILANRRLNMTFINSIYRLVTDAVSDSSNSLKAVNVNFISTVREHFLIINDLFKNYYIKYAYNQYTLSVVIVTISLLTLILFFIGLLYSYHTKRSEQTKLLSSYEQITNEEVEHIISTFDSFEGRYLDSFKLFDEYKTKKVTFQKENTQFLFKKYQSRVKRDRNGEDKKYTYNILSNAKVEEEKEEKSKKNLINKQKMTRKYFASFLAIFSIIILYTIYFYYEISFDKNTINITQDIVFNLFASKFSLNYISFKLFNIIYRRMHIISDFNSSKEITFKALINTSHTKYNYLSIQINNNPQLFLSNITDIMSGKICDVVKIEFCGLKDFTEENGMRSITAFYFQSVDDAYSFYNTNYHTIEDLGRIFTDNKFTVVNLLIENLQYVYDELFLQINTSLDRLFFKALVNLVVISIVFGGAFIIGLVYKLISFIDTIKQDECLCKKLIAELPYEVVKGNYDMQKQLNGIMGLKE